ncbi:hypothetical protein D3C71_1185380 [compost metagenome]
MSKNTSSLRSAAGNNKLAIQQTLGITCFNARYLTRIEILCKQPLCQPVNSLAALSFIFGRSNHLTARSKELLLL